MKFSGMKVPQLDVPLIELESTDGQFVDLYNEYWLRSATICGADLAFEFVSTDRSVTALVRFIGVRKLRVVQPDDWVQGEADQIEHLLVRNSGPWPRIVFKAGGLEWEFDCAELRLIVEAT